MGDMHGFIGLHNLGSEMWPEGVKLTKDDYLIILGDFGLVWSNDKNHDNWLSWLNNRPWTTLFIDGNHENFDLLATYPIEKWHGGKIQKISSSIFHLMRGQVFEIEGKTFFTFGGAASVDRCNRTPGISWWYQEIPNAEEINEALHNLSTHDNSVDYVLTHTCPSDMVRSACPPCTYFMKLEDPTTDILSEFEKILTFKHWYFGHFHTEKKINEKFTVMYESIRKLKEEV